MKQQQWNNDSSQFKRTQKQYTRMNIGLLVLCLLIQLFGVFAQQKRHILGEKQWETKIKIIYKVYNKCMAEGNSDSFIVCVCVWNPILYTNFKFIKLIKI